MQYSVTSSIRNQGMYLPDGFTVEELGVPGDTGMSLTQTNIWRVGRSFRLGYQGQMCFLV